MKQRSFKEFINSAAKHAILFSIVTIVSIIISLSSPSLKLGAAEVVLSVLIWCTKVVLVGYLSYRFVKAYSNSFEEFSYGEGFRYCLTVCFLSSALCSAFMLVSVTILYPDTQYLILNSIEKSMRTFGGTTEGLHVYDSLNQHFGKYITITYFLYYMFFGLIVSAIVPNFTKKETIF